MWFWTSLHCNTKPLYPSSQINGNGIYSSFMNKRNVIFYIWNQGSSDILIRKMQKKLQLTYAFGTGILKSKFWHSTNGVSTIFFNFFLLVANVHVCRQSLLAWETAVAPLTMLLPTSLVGNNDGHSCCLFLSFRT